MYESHFGLRRRPFPAVPTTETYYPATCHERALSDLLQAIKEDEGLALVTGEPGTGKTLLGHCLLDRLGDEVAAAFLLQGHYQNRSGLLQAILYDFSLPASTGGEQELRQTLTEFLLKNYQARRRSVLVVDEAQELTPHLLEELRLLGNLEGTHGRAFQVVLLALPHIEETLQLPELCSFRQRLAVRACLEPLGLHEAADYLVSHLRACAAKDIATEEALEIVARGTGGVPRLLNRVMHQGLRLACQAGERVLDAEAALEALSLLGLADLGAVIPAGGPLALVAGQHAGTIGEEASSQPVLVLGEEEDEPRVNDTKDSPRVTLGSPRRPA